MRRGLLLVLTWLVGTAMATTLAWGAVSVVRRNVTDRRVAPLSARAVSEALDTTPDTEAVTTATSVPEATSVPGATDTTATGPTVPSLSGGRSVTPTTRAGAKTTPTTSRTGATTQPGGTTGGTTAPAGSGSAGGGATPTGGSSTSPAPTTTTTANTAVTRRFPVLNHGQNVGYVDIVCRGSNVSHGSAGVVQGWNYFADPAKNGPVTTVVKFQANDGSHETTAKGFCDASGTPAVNFEER